MKLFKILPAFLLATTLFFTSCAPKDADIKSSIESKLQSNSATAGTLVMVNDGVATLSGEVSSDNARAESEKTAKDTKGVKSVMNNITVKSAAPVVISTDEPLRMGAADATKDHPTVTATVMNGVITLNGEIKKSALPKLMMTLNTLRPTRIDNNLTVK